MANREELEAEGLKLFLGIGLDETVAKNAIKNPKFCVTLIETIKEAGADGGCAKPKGNLLYTVATKFPPNALVHRPTLVKAIMDEQVKTVPQVEGSHEYLKRLGPGPLDGAAFNEAAGIGVVVTPEQIKAAVAEAVAANKERLLEERYRLNTNIMLGGITRSLKWADGASVRAELEAAVEALLGPKTEADLAPPPEQAGGKKKAKPPKPLAPATDSTASAGSAANAKLSPRESAPSEVPAEPSPADDDPYEFLPKPDENNVVHTTINFSDGRIMRVANSPAKLAEHLKETGGKVVTRFPPEPNGYLHIGHAKAMFVDFGMARQYDGVCYLRYDDTNPEAEKQEYITHIQEIVGWMGWAPWKITYSSDYFDQLYAFAVELIRRGHAYVCHQTKDEIAASRANREPSPWRDRPVAESLALFEDMRRGLVDEGKATLRMKMDVKNENYNMFDLIAYRIKFAEHPHAGDKWCVYPSYDYTHCLVDALENITHSLCTLEFETRRASYYWLLDVLDTYKPFVWEYGRLNITYNVMSKRRLNRLVTQGYVRGWDDPRLLTLAGLRRRGVPAVAINRFCREVGITRNDTIVPMHKLEHHIRLELDASASRALAVLRPLKVVITNLPDSHYEEVAAKRFPGRTEESYNVPFTKVVYIEATDFRETDSKDYYGLAPGKAAMLRYAYPITITGFTKDPATGAVTELAASVDVDFRAAGRKPPKGVLNWVGQPAPGQDPPTFEARLYDYLFSVEDPGSLGADEWLGTLNADSLAVATGGFLSPALAGAKPGDVFQFERLGYFAVDPDSKPGPGGSGLVFNRTVSLKEAAAVKAVK